MSDLQPTFNTAATPSPPAVGDLVAAVKRNNLKAVKDLLARGADVNERDDTGYTPLMAAAVLSMPTILAFLIEQKADLEMTMSTGMTALFWAVYNTSEDNACLLADKGANVNVADDEGMTPLLWAVRRGRLKPLVSMIAHGGDLAQADKSGRTVWDWEREIGRKEIKEALENAAAIRAQWLEEEKIRHAAAAEAARHNVSLQNREKLKNSAVRFKIRPGDRP